MSSSSNAADKPPENHTTHPPPSLSSLPDEIVLKCLALVPRSYHLSLSWVSKDFRSLVRSPELNALRSRSSIHVCFQEYDIEDNSIFHWFTLDEEGDGLVLNPTPFPPHPNYASSTVAVGSKIFFIGGSGELSTDLWILDTRSGNMTQGPSMSVPREQSYVGVGVIDGKIHVIGGGECFPVEGWFLEEIQVEVFDPKSETWELAGEEIVRKAPRCSASVEGKVYMVEYVRTSTYNPRECEGERLVETVSERLEESGRKERLNDMVDCVCVVEDVLFAFVRWKGIVWFDAERSVWRQLLGRDGKQLPFFHLPETAMAEHHGRLVVLYPDIIPNDGLFGDNTIPKDVRCELVSLHRSGLDRICGTVDWSGVVATVPYSFSLLHCLAVCVLDS